MVGTGGEDWVELDMDLLDRRRTTELESLLKEKAETAKIQAVIGGPYDVEAHDDGTIYIIAQGQRRYVVDINNDDRIVLTGLLDPNGPL